MIMSYQEHIIQQPIRVKFHATSICDVEWHIALYAVAGKNLDLSCVSVSPCTRLTVKPDDKVDNHMLYIYVNLCCMSPTNFPLIFGIP